MNEKPRMMLITDDDIAEFKRHGSGLSTPYVFWIGTKAYADADELRAWRSQRQSDVEAT